MRIGIPGNVRDHAFGIDLGNYDLIEQLGGTPVVISPANVEEAVKCFGVDAILLPGGADVSTKRYTFIPGIWSGKPDSFHEYFDTVLLPHFVGKIPIIGICRGLQTLNVHFGGKLYQHLRNHPFSNPNTQRIHQVDLYSKDGSKVLTSYGKKYRVNSTHHQGISSLANVFNVCAIADDGLIEGISHKSLPIVAVQWHPERIFDPFALDLFKSVLK